MAPLLGRDPIRPAVSLLLLGILVYSPGLTGGFTFDDYHNIVDNTQLRPAHLTLDSLLRAALSSTAGPLRRPLASLSFLANYHWAGPAALSFKLTNLAIHLVTGLLLLALLKVLLPRLVPARGDERLAARLAFLVALAWTLHPLNLTAVLYVVQRMTSLATAFLLIACLTYTKMRVASCAGRTMNQAVAWAVIAMAGLLGLACKETAALLPLLLLVIELAAFDFVGAPTLRKLAYVALLLTGIGLLYWAFNPEILTDAYRERPFSATERGLTELRILFSYLGQIVLPTPERLGLFHANWTLSRGLLTPWTTALATGIWFSALAFASHYRRRARLVFFALTWYLAGHLLESTVIPLDLSYEHRNYLPSIGVICLVLFPVAKLFATEASVARLIACAILLALGAQTAYRAWQWSDPITLAMTEARHHPDSSQARYEYGRIRYLLYLTDKRPADLALARAELEVATGLSDEGFLPLSGLVKSYLASDERMPATLLPRLRHELQSGQPNQRRLSVVFHLIECQMSRACRMAPDVVLAAVGATFDNPRLTPAAKAMILEWLAVYYTNVLGDISAARKVITEAMEIDPAEWTYRLRLVEVLIAQKDWLAAAHATTGLPEKLGAKYRYTEPAITQRLASVQQQLRDHP